LPLMTMLCQRAFPAFFFPVLHRTWYHSFMAENSTGGYHSDGCIQFLKFDLNETYFVKLHTIRRLTTVVSTYFLLREKPES
jgi:hypothetical protein